MSYGNKDMEAVTLLSLRLMEEKSFTKLPPFDRVGVICGLYYASKQLKALHTKNFNNRGLDALDKERLTFLKNNVQEMLLKIGVKSSKIDERIQFSFYIKKAHDFCI